MTKNTTQNKRVIRYRPSKTAARFHASDKVVRGYMGPVGNGKSVACIQELWKNAKEQEPNNQGIRLSRYAIIRNTSEQLRTTTLNTFKQWFPESICEYKHHPMMTARIQVDLPDETVTDAEFYFIALDREDDVRKLLSLELTGVFINETREIHYAVVKAARERIGRYPAHVDGYEDTEDYQAPRVNGKVEPCTRKILIMDTNPPDTEHWWYQLAEEGCLRAAKNKAQARQEVSQIFEFFRGPSPFIVERDGSYTENPEAENIEFLPGGYQYYRDMIAGNTEDHINVMVLGNYGAIKSGKPVYPEYRDTLHCYQEFYGNKPMLPNPELPINLSWDFGLTPCCLISQETDMGQIRILVELVSEDMGIRQFARDAVKPFMQKNFSGYEIGFSLADPAGTARVETDEKTAIGILNDLYDDLEPLNMGFVTEPAPTNNPARRIDAVKQGLISLVDGGPKLVIDKRCRVLRKGFMSEYKYAKRNASANMEELYKDAPDKNQYSHIHDALQYSCLGYIGGYVVSSEEKFNQQYGSNPSDSRAFNDDIGQMGY